MQPTTATKLHTYQRHRPEESVLYKIIQDNLETFLAAVHEETGHGLPDFVEKEFREYLKCGILAYGFLRTQCESCHKEGLIAFSCKRRGFCPSCGGRRMSETAIHLVDSVLPMKPIRQWVLSFPIQLRLLLAIRPRLMGDVLHITNECVSGYLRKKAGLPKTKAKSGSVTLIQRFGGSINLNVHFHQLFIDGVYELNENNEPDTFHLVAAPSRDEIAQVLEKIIKYTLKLLEKRGIIVKDEEQNLRVEIDEDDSFAKLQAGAVSYRFAFGPNKGKKALTLKTVPEAAACGSCTAPASRCQDHNSDQGLVAKNSGFSLHAGVAVASDERKKLEKIARYIARPAVALERLSLNSQGQVVYTLKKAYTDGTSHIVMEPLELLEKLAAIVPRPKVHLTRFHGVLAPHYKHRHLIVPKPKPVLEVAAGQASEPVSRARISWARLLKRIFDIDLEICGACGGKVKVIAAIEEPAAIAKILKHLGLPHKPPIIAPARGPPQIDVGGDFELPPFDFA